MDDIEKLFQKFIDFLKSEKKEVSVAKAVDTEKRKALFVVLAPDEVDLHGDIYSTDEVEKACRSFNLHCQKANLFHRVETQDAEVEQSYTAPTDLKLETPEGEKFIKKGTWLQQWHFPAGNEVSDKLWSMVKSGEIDGVSIGAMAKVENLDDQ